MATFTCTSATLRTTRKRAKPLLWKKRLLGKIPAGQHEIVPTRPKKAVGVNKELRVNANKLRIGALEILH